MDYSFEELQALGFILINDHEMINHVNDKTTLVINELDEELYIYLEDTSTRLMLNTLDVKEAINLCKIIVGVESEC